jgi:hypothetical protein
MPQRARERIGPFVVTTARNLDPDHVVCAHCGKQLASIGTDAIDPSPEALISAGAIAWPNFGWFCSAECEQAYSREFHASCSQREAAGGADDQTLPRTVVHPAKVLAGLILFFGMGVSIALTVAYELIERGSSRVEAMAFGACAGGFGAWFVFYIALRTINWLRS